jgi:L-aminopeptidase/D-esterase-like protein
VCPRSWSGEARPPPVGQALGHYYLKEAEQAYQSGGSIVVIVATDAPLSDRNLGRLARRAFIGVGNTGSSMGNGSGDYALGFSTAEAVRRTPARRREAATIEELPNDKISPLFQAVIEATEEAIYNAMLRATSMLASTITDLRRSLSTGSRRSSLGTAAKSTATGRLWPRRGRYSCQQRWPPAAARNRPGRTRRT